jgi:hypothetical protein
VERKKGLDVTQDLDQRRTKRAHLYPDHGGLLLVLEVTYPERFLVVGVDPNIEEPRPKLELPADALELSDHVPRPRRLHPPARLVHARVVAARQDEVLERLAIAHRCHPVRCCCQVVVLRGSSSRKSRNLIVAAPGIASARPLPWPSTLGAPHRKGRPHRARRDRPPFSPGSGGISRHFLRAFGRTPRGDGTFVEGATASPTRVFIATGRGAVSRAALGLAPDRHLHADRLRPWRGPRAARNSLSGR